MSKKNTILYIGYILIGIVLVILGCAEITDAFWSGMGGALLAVGALRLVQSYRLRKDDAYREKYEINTKDERISFIRTKAWCWAGYLFVLVCGAAVIVCRIIGQPQLSIAASYAVCLLLILYWGSYFVLRKKY